MTTELNVTITVRKYDNGFVLQYASNSGLGSTGERKDEVFVGGGDLMERINQLIQNRLP